MATDHECGQISAFDFDIVREAFRQSVSERKIAEVRSPDYARQLFQELSDEEADDSIISHIIAR
jgi:hypothetical protein